MDAQHPIPTLRQPEAVLAALASGQYGVFSRRQALARGITDSCLKNGVARGRYRRARQGIYAMTSTPSSWRQRLMIACLIEESGVWASHRAAAELWNLPGFSGTRIEVTSVRNVRSTNEDLIVHQVSSLPECDRAFVDGIPVTNPTRTIVDLAGVVGDDTLEIALDDAIRRRLTSVSRLRWRMDALPRRRGHSRLRRLLEERSVGTAAPESPLESEMLRLLRRYGLPEPERQYAVKSDGRFLARVDFAYPTHKVAIEVDGYAYHAGKLQWERDLARRNALEAAGWKVINVTAKQLREKPDEVAATVRRLIDGQQQLFRRY